DSIGASTGRTIQDIETELPPLKGKGASFREYVAARRALEEDLNNFYNNTNFWKHGWDAEVCRKEEFYKIANNLLKMIGGSFGRPEVAASTCRDRDRHGHWATWCLGSMSTTRLRNAQSAMAFSARLRTGAPFIARG
ncbi:hypothetical protein BGZ47_004527, partial [Haplosporangium gracile]